jgi:pimeloyl-ACP methyl ester carboxylesterase
LLWKKLKMKTISRLNLKTKLLVIVCLLMPVSYFIWQKWTLTIPQSLPEQSEVSVSKSDAIIRGTYYQVSIPPTKNDYYLVADYRIWLPDGVAKIRGLIVKQHGCGDPASATGLDHANDLQWQALALKHQSALIGSKLPSGDGPCENWAQINNGSGKAFFQALAFFAQKSGHPELEGLPWMLWGHSGGADWTAQMMQQYPDRTIAVIAARAGGFTFFGTNPNLANVPVLFALGDKDLDFFNETQTLPTEVFLRYRKINALWAWGKEVNTAHETSDTRLLAIPYLDAIATLRMTKDSNQLLTLNPAQGWLGNITTKEVTPADKYKGNPQEAAWFPNEETALKWQQYVTKGKISPTSKPQAPTNVSATDISSTEKVIKWNFTPDLENGLPSFRIYRNNSLIQTLEGQKHNFGDAPEPTNIKLEFKDTKANPNSTYTVAAFNRLGESVSRSTIHTRKP